MASTENQTTSSLPLLQVVHRVGRHFGFQAFNFDPSTRDVGQPRFVKATIFLATDHLYHLLVRNSIRRDTADGSDDDKFARSVFRLHAAIFQGYYDWCHHVELPPRVSEMTFEMLQKFAIQEWEFLLDELAMYFLIYSEAANLRHTPEALWFLFWCLRNSKSAMLKCMTVRETQTASHSLLMTERVNLRQAIRNAYHPLLKQWRTQLELRDEGDPYSLSSPCNASEVPQKMKKAEVLVKNASEIISKPELAALLKGANAEGCKERFKLLVELIVYGDGGTFLEGVVQPIFSYLAEEVGVKGSKGIEIGARVAYDDCNESLCRADNVHKVLKALNIDAKGRRLEVVFTEDPYETLISRGQKFMVTNEKVKSLVSFDPDHATEWWRVHVFGKTFIERRSIWCIYRSFFRVWMFLLMEFAVMGVATWGVDNWNAWAALPMVHGALCLLEQFAGAWTQRKPKKGVILVGNPFWGRYAKGVLDWLIINAILWLSFVCQITNFFKFDLWYWVVAGYSGLVVTHAIIITRPGYCISITHSLGGMFRHWARDSGCCYYLWLSLAKFLEWWGSSSARPRPMSYLAPYQLRVKFTTFLMNALFWVLVLGTKGVFDWYAIMFTMKKPVIGLWELTQADWNDSTGLPINTDPAVIKLLNTILCIARVSPGFLVMMSDIQIFYYIVMALIGLPKGLLQLNLGSITSFQELVSGFGQAPFQWWQSCVSKEGKDNLRSAFSGPDSSHHDGEIFGDGMLYTEQVLTASRAIAKHQPNRKLNLDSGDGVAKWMAFSDAWNAIVEELRQCDLLSNSERDNLKFVQLKIDSTILAIDGMRPLILPVFFYGGQVAQALETPDDAPAQVLALSEIRALLVWIVSQLNIVDKDQMIALSEFVPVKKPINLEHRRNRSEAVWKLITFLKHIKAVMGKAPDQVAHRYRQHVTTIELLGSILSLANLIKKEAEIAQKSSGVKTAQHAKACAVTAALTELLQGDGRLTQESWRIFVNEEGALQEIFAEAPPSAVKENMHRVVNQILKMLETTSKGAQPRGEEANRVLAFFMGSMRNPTLEEPPSVQDMLSFNTLTPHYEEDVIYPLDRRDVAREFNLDQGTASGLNDLMSENNDGVTTIAFLKSFYSRDWMNLMERLGPEISTRGRLDPRLINENDFSSGGDLFDLREELMMWASHRGQLLARTVRGMMTYETALRRLAEAENLHIPAHKRVALVEDLVQSKFTYVVASQVYGKCKAESSAKGRWLARGMDMLLHKYPGLRVAYLDSQVYQKGQEQFAVLIRKTGGMRPDSSNSTEELYRIKLPKNKLDPKAGVILGEGKPENQNSAIIFCFGEVVQAIDMNQDNYLAEAFKMRNLVSEFNAPVYGNLTYAGADAIKAGRWKTDNGRHTITLPTVSDGVASVRPGVRAVEKPFPNMAETPVALVGFREYVFSQDSGALASFAAATEFTFGSIVQRIMTWPGGVRFHYGHPDLWNKLFVMTRGGISKATKAFHISEDVFAGYNSTLRGGKTKFKEYISVGKGRDMGFDSINGFEAKVSGGNGEQVISRDVHRLATRLDFFRLLAFYCSGPGFFISTYFVLLSVYVNLWMLLLISLTNFGVIQVAGEADINTLTGQPTSVSVQQIIQLGMFSIITYFMEYMLEYGILKAIGTLLLQMLQGSISFFVFRARTTSYFFKTDVLYGGAKYVATGRGYALKHNSFVWVYKNYGRSHLYYAFELLGLLIILALSGASDYPSTTWSSWLVCISILWAPFWCNPNTFQLEKVKDDYDSWSLWMRDVADSETNSTWSSFNKEQLERPRNDRQTLLNPFGTTVRGIVESLPTAILSVAALIEVGETRYDRWVTAAVISVAFWVGVIVMKVMRALLYKVPRAQRLVGTLMVLVVITYFILATFLNTCGHGDAYGVPDSVLQNCDVGKSIKNMVFIVYANLACAHVVTQVLLYGFSRNLKARAIVDQNYRFLDWSIGYFYFLMLLPLAFVQVFDWVQRALLFNLKFAKKLEQAKILGNNLTAYVDRALERMKKALKEEQAKEAEKIV